MILHGAQLGLPWQAQAQTQQQTVPAHLEQRHTAITMDISNKSDDQQKLAGRKYLRWDDPNVEKKQEGEDEDIRAVAEQINAIQKAQYNSHRHCYSGRGAEDSFVEDDDTADRFRHACSDARYR